MSTLNRKVSKYKLAITISVCSLLITLTPLTKAYSDTAPNTLLTINSGTFPAPINGWYNTAIPILLQASNGTNNVQSVNYQIDSGSSTRTAGNSVNFDLIQQGIHTLYYSATDSANLSEPVKSWPYKIDILPPR